MAMLSVSIRREWNDLFVKQLLRIFFADKAIQELLIERGKDKGPYINITVKCRSGVAQWKKMKSKLNRLPGFRGKAIVICTGKEGWNDYIDLQHFNQFKKSS